MEEFLMKTQQILGSINVTSNQPLTKPKNY